MKKNRMLKIASAMIMLCLITTCAIGTTFAKYTTADSAADTARVAKWGVEVSASGTMFGKAYREVAVLETDDTATVKTSDTAQKVVAPGTSNPTGIQIKLIGKPEVDFKVTATHGEIKDIFLNEGTYGTMVKAHGLNVASDMTNIYWFNGANYVKEDIFVVEHVDEYYKLMDKVTVAAGKYYPIQWGATVWVNGTKYVQDPAFPTLDAAVASLTGADLNKTYKANTDVSFVYELTWAWAFNVSAYADKCDTILGNIQAGDELVVKETGTPGTFAAVTAADYSLEVGCEISVTATQID